LVLQFFSHFGRDQFGMIYQKLLPVRKSGVSDRERPKDDSQRDADEGNDATTGDEVENSVEDEAAPFLPHYKIDRRHEDYAEIHYTISFLLIFSCFRELDASV
jgi:hypothetical protein